MNHRERVILELENEGISKMKCFGNSMTPILASGVLLTFSKQDDYEIGDIVFCKVKGKYPLSPFLIIKCASIYLIANNHGHENGWTKKIYGKAVYAQYKKNGHPL